MKQKKSIYFWCVFNLFIGLRFITAGAVAATAFADIGLFQANTHLIAHITLAFSLYLDIRLL